VRQESKLLALRGARSEIQTVTYRPTPTAAQMIVLLPTLALSALLGRFGVALMARIVTSLGFGMVLIWVVSVWQRRQP
jgi:hypothetical protein